VRTRSQRDTILNDSDALKPAQGIAQLLIRIATARVGLGARANATNSLPKTWDARDRWVTSIARHKFDAARMVHVSFLRARQDLCLDSPETVQDHSSSRPHRGVLADALDCELCEFGRTARVSRLAHFFGIDGKSRRGARKMRVIGELARRDLGKDDAQREDVGGEIKLVAEEDLGRHVCVRAAESQATGLLFVAGRDARKTKVCDLETAVRSEEEVLALEIAMDAFASMKVGEGTGNVGCKGKSETPWQWLGFVVNILTEVAYGVK
jgi:hypothetical protein